MSYDPSRVELDLIPLKEVRDLAMAQSVLLRTAERRQRAGVWGWGGAPQVVHLGQAINSSASYKIPLRVHRA